MTSRGGTTSAGAATLEYLVSYLVEYSLSIDNIFVIAVIMATIGVPAEFQHRLLFWGVLTAVVLRGAMILGGAVLIERFEWTIVAFGALLVFSALRILFSRQETIHPERHLTVRVLRRFFPVTGRFHGRLFFTRIDGRLNATPMLVALLLIESCDVLFAVDSIPAVFGITRDPFIVFTSNIFAVLGLALAVLRPGRADRPVSLLESRVGGPAVVHRLQDAAEQLGAPAASGLAGRDHLADRGGDYRLAGVRAAGAAACGGLVAR